jgi:hypothetical protein
MMENKEKSDLERLKEDYDKKKIIYNLPEFRFMAEDFEIEKVTEKETDFILRETRRTIIEKFSAYMHLFETMLNPSSGSLLIFSILKNLNEEDKKEIREVYKKLAKIQIESMKLDTIYSENNEAQFILYSTHEWLLIKDKIFRLFEKFSKDLDLNNSSISNCYFG